MANATTESQSLFLIQSLQRAIEVARSTMVFLDVTLPPSEILSMSDQFTKALSAIEGSINLAKASIPQLMAGYLSDIVRYRDMRNAMTCQVNDRKNAGAILNSNVELYDGENKLYHIEVCNAENKVFSVHEISQPMYYSVLSIYEKMTGSEEYALLNSLRYETVNQLTETGNYLQIFRDSILSYRKILNSPQFMADMATDISTPKCVSYIQTMRNSMGDLITKTETLRKKITDIFQVYLAMEKNYGIYKRAVDALVSIALECILDPYANLEFI